MRALFPRLAIGFAAALLAAAPAAAASADAVWKAPRNAFGQPDLEGVWTNASLTSLERGPQFKTLTIPEAQAQQVEAMRARMMAAQNRPSDPNAGAPAAGEDPGGYNSFWVDPGTRMGRIAGEVRTSWLVEPADGKLPYRPEGWKRYQDTLMKARNTFDGPEARPLGERCILGFGSTAGPPMMNVLYNNHYQIQQTVDAVVIVVEMNHDARIIRLTDTRRLPKDHPEWMGKSTGRWEGDTLVVETTGFNPGESLRPYFGASLYLSPDAKVTERFTRISKDQILYRFEVDDPAVYKSVWKAEMPLNASKGPVYEYACHEGNYSLPGILAGARKAEAEGRKPESVELSE
ncbi:MAG: hypothetical protein JNK30_22685 [Phenylobacterium sp.]|uniref:hypothetical protein n=1 Tax=Phenylobacterium sp. TaxID=1871053 RepID=UPI001A440B97|nr:hypothetical protein [Phenylobacterium sp.]MBL8774213.1 hypothetical protein [Phenylobacterium sp.]